MEQHTPKSTNTGGASPESLAKGYEPHDLSLRPVFMFIAGLAIVLVVVLAAIYAIMMALADSDRSTDVTPSPIAVTLPPPYAPLQPSLGMYDNHKNDHDVLDWQDMDALRYKATEELNSEGVVAETGRHHIAIADAITKVLPLMEPHVKPVAIAGAEVTTYPAGSYEGVYNDQRPPKPTGQFNDMNRLNNLGN